MIARLSEIQDPNNEEFISPERVGQIDMLFNSDPHKVVSGCFSYFDGSFF